VLPWIYGFNWNAGHIVFLGAFYAVLAALVATLAKAAIRSRRDLRAGQVEAIRWHSDFEGMPACDQVCRHVLTGEFRERQCPHAFDCRECETHAKLIECHPLPPVTEPEEDVFGMAFPLDRFYHRGHAWARPEKDGTVLVGLDELGARLLGQPDELRLPKPGDRVHANGAAFHARRRNAEVRVVSPIDGEVVETGSADRGWYLRVKPTSNDAKTFQHLLRGAEIKPWIQREMERLQLALTAEGAAPALADGGVPVSDIAAAYPAADWDAVCGEMFLEG
jgi:glycine cleavage system H lipoate-binding protein